MEAGAYYTELTHYTVLTYGGKRGSPLVVVLGCIHRYRIWNDHLTGECRLSARAAGDFKHVSTVTRSKTTKRDKHHKKTHVFCCCVWLFLCFLTWWQNIMLITSCGLWLSACLMIFLMEDF